MGPFGLLFWAVVAVWHLDRAACSSHVDYSSSPVTVLPSADCTGRLDGYYAQSPCSSTFYHCQSGSITQQVCPASLVYSTATGHCDYRSNVMGCLATDATRPVCRQRPTQGSSYASQDQPQCVTGTTSAMGECSGKYVECVGSKLVGKVCPVGTIFDGIVGICVFSRPDCTSVVPVVGSAPPAAQSTYHGAADQRQPITTATSTVPIFAATTTIAPVTCQPAVAPADAIAVSQFSPQGRFPYQKFKPARQFNRPPIRKFDDSFVSHEEDTFDRRVVGPENDVFADSKDYGHAKDSFDARAELDHRADVFTNAHTSDHYQKNDVFDHTVNIGPHSDAFQVVEPSLHPRPAPAHLPNSLHGFDSHGPLSPVPIDVFDVKDRHEQGEDTVFGVRQHEPVINVFAGEDDNHAHDAFDTDHSKPDVVNVFGDAQPGHEDPLDVPVHQPSPVADVFNVPPMEGVNEEAELHLPPHPDSLPAYSDSPPAIMPHGSSLISFDEAQPTNSSEVDVGSSSESELVEKPEETEETTSDTPSTTEEYSTTTSESTTTMEEASGDDDERSTDATDGEERRLRRSYDPFGSDFMPWPKPPTNRKFNAKTMKSSYWGAAGSDTVPPQSAPPVPASICATMPAGQKMALGFCRQDFVYCIDQSGGMAGACAVGDLFDEHSSTCVTQQQCGNVMLPPNGTVGADETTPFCDELVNNIPATGFIPTAYPPTSATFSTSYGQSSTSANDVSQQSGSFDCSRLPNGLQPVETCGPRFVSCSNGISSMFQCQSGLVFNAARQRCDYDCTSNALDSAAVVYTAPAMTESFPTEYRSTSTAFSASYGQSSTSANDVSQQSGSFDCSRLPNGLQPVETCGPRFVSCSNGISSMFQCQSGLVFNTALQRCDYDCTSNALDSATVAFTAPTSPYYASTFSTASPYQTEKPADVKINANCPENSSGFFAVQPCGNQFISCFAGVATTLTCQSGLMYDSVSHRCEYPGDVAACGLGADIPIPEAATTSYPTQPSSLTPSTTVYVVYQTTTPSESPIPGSIQSSPLIIGCEHDGIQSISPCNSNFMKCSNGVGKTFTCPPGLVYDSGKEQCAYPGDVAACGGADSVSTSNSGATEIPATTVTPQPFLSGDATLSSKLPSSYVATSETYVSASTSPAQSPVSTSTELPYSSNSYSSNYGASTTVGTIQSADHPTVPQCPESDGAFSVRRCGSQYLSCTNGVGTFLNCPERLVYDVVAHKCDFIDNVEACKTTGFDFGSSVSSYGSDESQQGGQSDSFQLSESADARCGYGMKSAVALGFCRIDYLGCLMGGFSYPAICVRGHLFDHRLLKCVPGPTCGGSQASWSNQTEKIQEFLDSVGFPDVQLPKRTAKQYGDKRCLAISDNKTLPIGLCRSSYILCSGGKALIKHCASRAQVYARRTGNCVPISTEQPCASRIPAPPGTSVQKPFRPATPSRDQQNNYQSSNGYGSDGLNETITTGADFCGTRLDGFYRHPLKCSHIVQCFGGDVFEYPPCSHGLVYNERIQQCDYRVNVPECSDMFNSSAVSTMTKGTFSADALSSNGCNGHAHGDHIRDESDCSVFYRCVWERLERMTCPETTVFNPELSVCDYPYMVPDCEAVTTTGSTIGSSSR